MVVITAGLELADGRGRRRLISLLVTLGACVAIMSASWSGALLRLKVVGSEGAWSQAARTACVGNRIGQLDLPSLGRVEQISCDGGQIIFPGPNNAKGLIYSTGSGQPGLPNECVGHISRLVAVRRQRMSRMAGGNAFRPWRVTTRIRRTGAGWALSSGVLFSPCAKPLWFHDATRFLGVAFGDGCRRYSSSGSGRIQCR